MSCDIDKVTVRLENELSSFLENCDVGDVGEAT